MIQSKMWQQLNKTEETVQDMKHETLLEVELNGVKFRLVRGDITSYPADAIVNAANRYLMHGGGVALAIAKAASSADEYTKLSREEMLKQVGRSYIKYGEVVVTPALRMEKFGIKYVIHSVGPKCSGEWNRDFEEKLRKALRAPLEKAEELKLKSIAFPAVSAGIYGCPLDKVVLTLFDVVRAFAKKAKSLKEVSLVLYDEKSAGKALDALRMLVD